MPADSFTVDKTTGLQCDQIVGLNNPVSQTRLPRAPSPELGFCRCPHSKAPRVPDQQLPAPCINSYPVVVAVVGRWNCSFAGSNSTCESRLFTGLTGEHRGKLRVWIAISVYVLVAIIKKRLHLTRSLHSILQILSISLLEKTPILRALSATETGMIFTSILVSN